MVVYEDPYAPKVQPVKAGQLFPVDRLGRLAVSGASVDVYRAWWSDLEVDGRRRAVTALAVLTDTQLADQASDIDWLMSTRAAEVDSWARAQPDRWLSAGLARHAEQARQSGGRAGVLSKLEQILKSAG